MTHFLLRNCLALALTSGVVGAAHAQSSTPAADALPAATTEVAAAATSLLPPTQLKGTKYKTYLTQRYANDKEARAVIHLFSRKQLGGALWLSTGALVVTLVSSQTGTTVTSSGTRTTTVTPLGYGLMVGLFGGVGIGKLARFGNGKLYQALADYDQSHSFPGYVMEHLKEKDYR